MQATLGTTGDLAGEIHALLRETDPVRWSGIVSLDPAPLDAAAIVADGYRRRIVAAERGGLVRLSPHLFTSDRELDRAVDWLWAVRAGRSSSDPGFLAAFAKAVR